MIKSSVRKMIGNKSTNKLCDGFSLIEMMVVISVFAVIGILTTSVVALTLKTSKKSDSLIRTRENVNYALAVIERQIRNAESIEMCTGAASQTLSYSSIEGVSGSFTCVAPTIDTTGYIASGSARLTSDDISITSCTFTCSQTDANNPPSVKVSIAAEDSTSSLDQGSFVTSEIEIVTRNY